MSESERAVRACSLRLCLDLPSAAASSHPGRPGLAIAPPFTPIYSFCYVSSNLGLRGRSKGLDWPRDCAKERARFLPDSLGCLGACSASITPGSHSTAFNCHLRPSYAYLEPEEPLWWQERRRPRPSTLLSAAADAVAAAVDCFLKQPRRPQQSDKIARKIIAKASRRSIDSQGAMVAALDPLGGGVKGRVVLAWSSVLMTQRAPKRTQKVDIITFVERGLNQGQGDKVGGERARRCRRRAAGCCSPPA